MSIKKFIGLTSAERRKIERQEAAKKVALGVGILAVAAAAGVATGILVAPMSGKKTRKGMENNAIDTIETIKDTIQKKADEVKNTTTHAAEKATDAIKGIHKTTENISHELEKAVK